MHGQGVTRVHQPRGGPVEEPVGQRDQRVGVTPPIPCDHDLLPVRGHPTLVARAGACWETVAGQGGGVLETGPGGVQRGNQPGALVRGQDRTQTQHAVAVERPGHSPCGPPDLRITIGLPVGTDEPLHLTGRAASGTGQPQLLSGGLGDPGHRPHLRIRHRARRERRPKDRKTLQRPRRRHLLPRRAQADTAPPGQPVRTRPHPDPRPATPTVERRHRQQPATARRGDPPRPPADRLLHLPQRCDLHIHPDQRARIRRGRGDRRRGRECRRCTHQDHRARGVIDQRTRRSSHPPPTKTQHKIIRGEGRRGHGGAAGTPPEPRI
ncbi:hypothetical protein FF36_00792 [Frankia torreyi]|uniref:Uncharacterized protein n=1 Tax=Frankia torreyi TaxID=1856 RepID=A0A0D8BL20_9ACTN|nr:hypothetical protein FF36_00792 [Frankia torreyi]KQM07045.1 hypothetical protein FF86_1005132 [Frankia sp. CpI1-P]